MTYKFDTKVLVSVNPKSGLATENFMLFFRIKYSFLTVLTFLCHSEEPFLFSLTRNCNIVEEFSLLGVCIKRTNNLQTRGDKHKSEKGVR